MFDVSNTRFTIMGDWEEGDPDGVVLRLVPDNGACYAPTSPATIAMLQEMDQVDFEGKTVLDFGTGSGILAIAAASMGAIVTAIDHNPRALFAAAISDIANLYDGAGEVSFFDDDPGLHYDVILANVGDSDLLTTLIDRCDLLIGTAKTVGRLLSGGRGTKPHYEISADDLARAAQLTRRTLHIAPFNDEWAVIRG